MSERTMDQLFYGSVDVPAAYMGWEKVLRRGRVRTTYGLRPWWKALCKWCVAGNEALTIKTIKAFPRALWFSIRTRSMEGTLWL